MAVHEEVDHALSVWALAAVGGAGPGKGADKMTIYRAAHEPDWDLFDKANKEEVEALWRNQTWELVNLPPGKSLTGMQMLC